MIREGTICESCRMKLVKDVRNNAEDEKRRQEQDVRDGQVSFKIKDRLKDRHY